MVYQIHYVTGVIYVCVRAWVGGLYIHAFAVRTVTDTFGQNRIHIMLIVTSAWKI